MLIYKINYRSIRYQQSQQVRFYASGIIAGPIEDMSIMQQLDLTTGRIYIGVVTFNEAARQYKYT